MANGTATDKAIEKARRRVAQARANTKTGGVQKTDFGTFYNTKSTDSFAKGMSDLNAAQKKRAAELDAAMKKANK